MILLRSDWRQAKSSKIAPIPVDRSEVRRLDVHIHKTPGVRNDLLVVIPTTEMADAVFHIANRERLMSLPGLLRHVHVQNPDERQAVNDAKRPVEDHLRQIHVDGLPILGENGTPTCRAIAVGARSVGSNHGVIAWQADQSPRFFHVQGDPLDYPSYSCLTYSRDGTLSIRDLRFASDRVIDGDHDITETVRWCTFGNPILRGGRVTRIEDVIGTFSDIRHVLAFERELARGRQVEDEIYDGYPQEFREKALRALRHGVPRQRFLHNCVGISEHAVFLMQREGTIEEAGYWLQEAGARDGVILDNGASPFCWAWWPYPSGGFLFTAPDYRPRASAVIAFILHGSVRTNLPSGSVGFTIV